MKLMPATLRNLAALAIALVYTGGAHADPAVGQKPKEDGWKAKLEAVRIHKSIAEKFPDSKWAKYARGRLADPELK